MFHRLCWDWQDGSVFISLCCVYFFKWACMCRQMLAFFNWPINMKSEDLWQKKTGAAVVKEELKTPGKPENHKSCNFLKIGSWTFWQTQIHKKSSWPQHHCFMFNGFVWNALIYFFPCRCGLCFSSSESRLNRKYWGKEMHVLCPGTVISLF